MQIERQKNRRNAVIITGLVPDKKKGIKAETTEKPLPKGWYQTCVQCPIQYSKIVKIKGRRYEGYIRSRWGSPFSISIYELDKNNEWVRLAWEHKPLEQDSENPPLKSMKLIDEQFERLEKGETSEIMGLFYELYDNDFKQLPTQEQITKFFMEMDRAIISKQTELATDYTGLLYALVKKLLKKEAGK